MQDQRGSILRWRINNRVMASMLKTYVVGMGHTYAPAPIAHALIPGLTGHAAPVVLFLVSVQPGLPLIADLQ
jgi:hypothetical protein